jgi:hypothetical protein
MRPLLRQIAESFSSTWTLLSDTTNFLSRVKLLDEYEAELFALRARLSRSVKDPVGTREVRDAVVAIRRGLRLRGFDLHLGSKDAALEGFRHDDAFSEGFRRVVIGIADDDVVGLAGDDNHNILADALQDRLRTRRAMKPYRMHFLWYRWRNQVLVLSGAASETAEQFEELKAWFPANKELLLRKLKNL